MSAATTITLDNKEKITDNVDGRANQITPRFRLPILIVPLVGTFRLMHTFYPTHNESCRHVFLTTQ
jgi:hypothetical protein